MVGVVPNSAVLKAAPGAAVERPTAVVDAAGATLPGCTLLPVEELSFHNSDGCWVLVPRSGSKLVFGGLPQELEEGCSVVPLDVASTTTGER